MKTIQILTAVSILALSAVCSASSMQIICANPQSSVRINDDYRDRNVTLIETEFADVGVTEIPIVFGPNELKTIELKSTPIETIQNGTCKGEVDWYSVRSFYYRHVQFQRADGGEFSNKISGARLSPDKKTLEVQLMCERHVTGMRPCQNR